MRMSSILQKSFISRILSQSIGNGTTHSDSTTRTKKDRISKGNLNETQKENRLSSCIEEISKFISVKAETVVCGTGTNKIY